MNLVNCAEKCLYQDDGLCRLPVGASASVVPIESCCYFVPADNKKFQIDKNVTNAQN